MSGRYRIYLLIFSRSEAVDIEGPADKNPAEAVTWPVGAGG